jgi:hypothetical protein
LFWILVWGLVFRFGSLGDHLFIFYFLFFQLSRLQEQPRRIFGFFLCVRTLSFPKGKKEQEG